MLLAEVLVFGGRSVTLEAPVYDTEDDFASASVLLSIYLRLGMGGVWG